MWQWIIFSAIALYVTCMSGRPAVAEFKSSDIPDGDFVLETKENIPDTITAYLALTAMDRQCGSCHHPNRSTNEAALAIFDLADDCWYCPLSPHQTEKLIGRTESSSFSEEERNAIAALLAQLHVSH